MNTNASRILDILATTYPKAFVALHFSSPWELLVAVQLAAQCTDVRVNLVTKDLFNKYPTLEAYFAADIGEFEGDIHSTGFYRNKAKHILAAAKLVREKFAGQVPKTMEELLTIPGMGRKSANVVLGNAYGIVEGIAVDTHVLRVSKRLDFTNSTDPLRVEQDLMSVVPKKDWLAFTYQMVDHGRALCHARTPNCRACPLRTYCPVGRSVV